MGYPPFSNSGHAGFNSREMGMGDDYYKLPEVEEHIYNIKNAYIRGDYVDPIRVRVIDGVPFVRRALPFKSRNDGM